MGGYPGVEATVARRDREAGDDGDDADTVGEWFLGSITAGPQRIVTVDCSFLGSDVVNAGDEWTVEVVRDDGQDGLETEEWTVTGEEALDVVVPQNGGFAARFTR